MNKIYFISLLILLNVVGSRAQPVSPRALYADLFEKVQLRRVFQDQKTFVDCVPRVAPAEIMRLYNAQKQAPDFNLKNFVVKNFILPATDTNTLVLDPQMHVEEAIDTLWTFLTRQPDTVTRESLLSLPYSYIVPGSRFREIYYWDSYFTMLGLRESGDTTMIENMVSNFAYLIDEYGFIPNGNRSYYLTRSQPPFFSLMIELLAQLKGQHIYLQYLPELVKEYNFWMRGADSAQLYKSNRNTVYVNGALLNRYWDESAEPREESYLQDVTTARSSAMPAQELYRNIRAAAESGWDFSSRWFADGENPATIYTTDIVPVDLNCLLYKMERVIAYANRLKGDKPEANRFDSLAQLRAEAILNISWSKERRYFCDYLWKESRTSDALTLAGVFPLYFKLATAEEAKKMKLVLGSKFLRKGGLLTTTNITEEQWDAPNGWAPLQYMAVEGLSNYGYNHLAYKVVRRWIKTNKRGFEATGKLREKYNVQQPALAAGKGEYSLQDGFGWTNGVLITFIHKYAKHKKHEKGKQ